jgi:hypothetical protein
MSVIDTNGNVSAQLGNLKNRGVDTVGRYYSSRAWKRITQQEAVAISSAGMKIFVVFENDGDPQLTEDNGIYHAQIAASQAKGIGQPEGTAIYFALEHLPNGYTATDVAAVQDYMTGVKQGLNGKYKVGAYSDGVVLDALLSSGVCDYAWLSASLSFAGSRAFLASGRWSLAQDPNIDQDWNGLSVDTNQAKADIGAFQVNAVAAPAAATSAPGMLRARSIAAPAAAVPAPVSSAADFASGVYDTATGEWKFFGQQTYDVNGHKTHAGHTEGEDGWYQRVGQYWLVGTNTHGIDGTDHDWPWSAAFISWVMKQAGAGDRFHYSTQHSVYIAQGIRDFLQKRQDAGYWTERLSDAKPAIGDIVCWARQAGIDYDHQNGGDYAGHADIVVEVDAGQVWIIGGNVGDSVTRRPLGLDANGYLKSVVVNGENLFGIMKNRMY